MTSPASITRPASTGDRVFRGVLRGAALGVLSITGLIAFFLVLKAWSALHVVGWSFITTEIWIPAQKKFGIASLLPNTVLIAIIALIVAIPVALATAIFVSEYARPALRRPLIALIDLMAAVPSIIYGLWGVFFLQPRILGTIRWMSEHLSWIPFFQVRGQHSPSSFTSSTFIAGLVVSLMVIPLIASISREVFSQAPGRRARGRVRAGMQSLGHGPHRGPALRTRRHDRRDHARLRAGHG